MNIWDKALILAQLGSAGLAWLRHDVRRPSPVPENPKFMSAEDAARLIGDRSVVAASGLGGHQRASILYWAIRERFEASGHPARLTVVNVGGHGGRGRVPGTLDELARPGLCTRLITSHFDTFHGMLALAAERRLELHCVPLGVLTLLLDGLGRGRDSLRASTGVGTFLDPRCGRGSPVGGRSRIRLIERRGRDLVYRIPPIDVGLFNVPAADRRGNLYVRDAAIVGESREIARAARRNGGKVIANVGLIVEEGYDRVFLPARMVDAIVWDPDTEQTGGVFHRDPWRVLTPKSDMPIEEGLERVRFVNSLLGITPRRNPADEILARLAAATLLTAVRRGARVSVGTGLPEEACRAVFEAGRLGDLTFVVESGVIGGLPAPGAYFGASLCPERIVSSAELFRLCGKRLDATCLGALEIDTAGNVNVSNRGDGVQRYTGPGGFVDFWTAADTIVFVSSWMENGRIAVEGGGVRILQPGEPKFVPRVREVTFNGSRALRTGKRVYYVTHVGVFRLTGAGLELASVVPGIDVQRDIVRFSRAVVRLPASGRVPLVSRSVLTGRRLVSGRARKVRRSDQKAGARAR